MGANIKISSDSKQFINEMKQVTNNLKLVDSTLSVATEKAKLFGSSTDKLKAQHAQLSNTLKSNNKILDLQNKTVNSLTSDIQKYTSRNTELSKSIASVGDKLKAQIKATGEDSKETKVLQQELNKLHNEYNSNGKAIDKANSSIDKYKTKMNETEKAILQNTKALENMDKKISTEKWEKISTATGKVGSALTKLSVPLVGAGVASSKFSMDFGDGMAKISTVADTSNISLKKLGQGVIDLSNLSGENFNSIQDGMYDTISSGVKAEDSINFLKVAVKSAKGGFTDTATAVDGLTSVLNAYGLKTEEATNISNQMFIAQNLGKTTFGEMSQYLGNVIPISSSLKVKTNELFSSLAVLTANGIKSSEAVTGLKSSMSNIIKPSKEASDAANSLGIDFSASAVATKGWLPFLQDVKNKLKEASPAFAEESDQVSKNSKRMLELANAGKKNSQEYKNLSKQNKNLTKDMEMLANMSDSPLSAFAQMFGSVEGLNTVLTLTSDQGIQLYNESMKQMKTNTTATDDAFNKISNTDGAKLRKSLNEAKNSLIGFGDAMSPVISNVAGGISNLTGGFNNLDQGQKNVVVGLGGFIVTSGLTLTAVSKITNVVKDAHDSIGLLKSGVGLLGDKFSVAKGFISSGASAVASFGKATGETLINVGKMTVELGIQAGKWIAHKVVVGASTIATGLMTIAQGALNFVMSLNPITLVVIALAGLVTGLVIAYHKCDWFRNMVNGAFKSVADGAMSAVNKVGGLFSDMWQGIKDIGSNIKGFWSSIWNFKLPHIPLPHFNIEGKFSIAPPQTPYLGVEWYKNGGIMTQPTMFGMNGNSAMVGGEAGQEAVLPLNALWTQLEKNFANLEQRLNNNTGVVYVYVENNLDGKKLNDIVTTQVTKTIGRKQKIRMV